MYGAIQVEVKTEKNQLLLVSGSGVTGKVILAYKGPLKFQVHITGSYNYFSYATITNLLTCRYHTQPTCKHV